MQGARQGGFVHCRRKSLKPQSMVTKGQPEGNRRWRLGNVRLPAVKSTAAPKRLTIGAVRRPRRSVLDDDAVPQGPEMRHRSYHGNRETAYGRIRTD